MRTAVIIPAYNVENNAVNVIRMAKKFADEVIVVNDGSRDKTANILKKLSSGNVAITPTLVLAILM